MAVSARLVLGLALGWAVFGFLSESITELRLYERRAENASPFNWRFGMAPVERFRICVAEAAALLPPGAAVSFLSQTASPDDDFFRWRWAAYWLPDRDVVRLNDPAACCPDSYLLTYRRDPGPDPRFEMLRQLRGGRLYWIRR